jgi:arylsulfatase A-like enzyme
MKSFLRIVAVALLVDNLAAAEKPNVVFILADDLGSRDLACFGSTFYETPNIDRLAVRGMKFTNAYGQPLCSPTRSALLTGLDPARTGITQPHCHMPQVVLEPKRADSAPPKEPVLGAVPVTRLKTEFKTLPEAFLASGYNTAHFGKWHLGPEPYSPLQQGYEVDVPHTNEPGPLAGGFFHPFKVWKDKGKQGDNLEDTLAAEAAAFIRQKRERPFFMSYWAFEVHSPWQAKPGQVEHFRAKADPKNPQRNAVYAGMVQSLDDAVGTLVQALEETGQLQNTIIIFLSDNGGYITPNKQFMLPEYHTTPPTSNAPLRDGKATLYEGGIRVPLIISWPGKIAAGTTSEALVSMTDWFPTFCELLSLPKPEGQPQDGHSFASALRGEPAARKNIAFHFPHGAQAGTSVREGNWKLIRRYAKADGDELYDLASDLGEATNLAAQKPEKVAALNAQLDAYLKTTGGIIPIANPAWVRPPDKK